MKFLRLLFLRFASWTSRGRTKAPERVPGDRVGLPYELAQGELVTRFIFFEKHIRKSACRPHLNAFMPPRNKELSVIHSTGLTEEAIWQTGQLTVGSSPERTKIRARADVPVLCLNTCNLRALRDDKPFKRHTSVVGWPEELDEGMTKARWKQICLELSEDPRITLALPVSEPL